MPGGRNPFFDPAAKIAVLKLLTLYDGNILKPRNDEVWMQASRQLGPNGKGQFYHPHSLWRDVHAKRIYIPMNQPEDDNSTSAEFEDERVEEKDEVKQLGNDVDSDVEDGVEIQGNANDIVSLQIPDSHDFKEYSGETNYEENRNFDENVDEEVCVAGAKSEEESNKCDDVEGNADTNDSSDKYHTYSSSDSSAHHSFLTEIIPETDEDNAADTDKFSNDNSFEIRIPPMNLVQKIIDHQDKIFKDRVGLKAISWMTNEEMDVCKTGNDSNCSDEHKNVPNTLNLKNSDVIIAVEAKTALAEADSFPQARVPQSTHEKTSMDTSEAGRICDEHVSKPNQEPVTKRRRLASAFLTDSLENKSSQSLQNVPVILAQPTAVTSTIFQNPWPLNCILQILLVAATDYETFNELVTDRAHDEDTYMFIKHARVNGLNNEAYQLRAMILQRVISSSSCVNEQIVYNCEMHVATMAERLMRYNPCYNELRKCSNVHCNFVAEKPVVIFAIEASRVLDKHFENILETEVIPHVQGKSCTECGGKAEITQQRIGDLVIFDVFSQANPMMTLDQISKSIINPLQTPPAKLTLLGVVQSKGSSGRLRSSRGSFVHHTALAYRPGNHWIEYNDEDPASVRKILKKNQKMNIQLLVYGKVG